jgi:hypothetical protein
MKPVFAITLSSILVFGCTKQRPVPIMMTQAAPAPVSNSVITNIPTPAASSATAPRATRIEGAFGWKLGEKAPAWVPLEWSEPYLEYDYPTTTNAPFSHIAITCTKDRTICCISAVSPVSTLFEHVQDEFYSVHKALVEKYGTPAPGQDQLTAARWDQQNETLRVLTVTLEFPRDSWEPSNQWHISVGYTDANLMEDAKRSIVPVGNGL